MATPIQRGAMLAARRINNNQVRGLAIKTHTTPVADSTVPPVSPAQLKALKRIEKVRTDELTKLVSNLSLFGPMPTPAPSADGTPPMRLSNPFLARKNIRTGKWRPPVYSLRRQADLAKMALKTGHLDKLPPGPKTTALKDRIERVKKSLPPSDIERLESSFVPVSTPVPNLRVPVEFVKTQDQVKALEKSIARLARRNSADQASLKSAPEAEKGIYKVRLERRSQSLADKKATLLPLVGRLEMLREHIKARKAAILAAHTERERLFTMPIDWVGKLPEKTKGAELGIRLYANRKRMFKGHRWERARASRVKKQATLMRFMAARVARYKDYYKKRRPNPLRPPRYTKPPKLPF